MIAARTKRGPRFEKVYVRKKKNCAENVFFSEFERKSHIFLPNWGEGG